MLGSRPPRRLLENCSIVSRLLGKIPGVDAERIERTEVRLWVLVDEADDTVTSVRHRQMRHLRQPQPRPHRLPRYGQEPWVPALAPSELDQQVAHRPRPRRGGDDRPSRVLNRAVTETSQQLPQVPFVDEVLRMHTGVNQRNQPGTSAPG